MSDTRKDDLGRQRSYRTSTSRIFQNQGQWYVDTREGTSEGPYYDRDRAARMLEAYVTTMSSCFAPTMEMSLVPI